jgi:hypothetical protein
MLRDTGHRRNSQKPTRRRRGYNKCRIDYDVAAGYAVRVTRSFTEARMKSLLILLLVVALAAALFLTRPTKADFEKYVRDDKVKIVDDKVTGGKTIADTIGDKMRTFAADSVNKSAADIYLEQCTFENRVFWTNVRRNGQVVYTGAVGQWFERSPSSS